MELIHYIVPRKRRHRVLLVSLLVSIFLVGIYFANSGVVWTSSTSSFPLSLSSSSSSSSRSASSDHGCYFQTPNLTQHRHPIHLLAKRNCQQRLPVALIVGGALCGTKTLRTALSFHPDVVVPDGSTHLSPELGLRDKDHYRALLPFSLPNQLTVDESQESMYIPNCPKDFADIAGQNLKVIALIRDPVARAMSEYLVLTSRHRDQYYSSLSHKKCFTRKENKTINSPGESVESEHGGKTKSKRHVKKLSRRDKHVKKERQKEKTKRKARHHRDKRRAGKKEQPDPKGSPTDPYKGDEIVHDVNATFEATFFGPDKEVKAANFLLQRSIYVHGLKRWRKAVEAENMLILDAEQFARDPADTLHVVEKFLGLKPHFKPEFFDFDLANGRLCFNSPSRSCLDPLAVQQPLPVLPESLVSELREFFIPWLKVQNRITRVYFPHLGEHPLVFTPFR